MTSLTAPACFPLERKRFQSMVDGQSTDLFTLANARGMRVAFTNLGAKILQIIVPDRTGAMDDVVLGYDSIEGVISGQSSIGAFIGRTAGRIAGGRFTLDGKAHQLTINHGGNCLHGGTRGSRFRVFAVKQLDAATCELALDYADGDQGYPGHVKSRLTYQVTEDNALDIRYEATTDAPTIVNFTSHGFFNLAGHGAASEATMSAHLLTIAADAFTPVNAQLIPTGEITPVAGTPFDFRQPVRVGERINHPVLMHPSTRGYDGNWVLNKPAGQYGLAATLTHPASGREMQVHSTEPGLVFFSGNHFAGEAPRDVGKGGKVYHCRAALCLEPGKFPDAANQPHFPSAVLNPGEHYSGVITYRFSAR